MKRIIGNLILVSLCVASFTQAIAKTSPQCLDKSFTLQL